MNWPMVFAVLVEMFAALLPFLQDLFAKVNLPGSPEAVDAPAAIERAFAAARAQTWKVQFVRRALLNRAEKVALRRAPEIVQAAKFGERAPMLSASEVEQVKGM